MYGTVDNYGHNGVYAIKNPEIKRIIVILLSFEKWKKPINSFYDKIIFTHLRTQTALRYAMRV